MIDILKLLSDSDIVQEYEIINLIQDEDFFYPAGLIRITRK
jgi:hypothetical protein